MGIATSFPECTHFVVEGWPVLAQSVGAGNDNVDFVSPIFDRLVDFFYALCEGAEASGKAGADVGDRDSGALEIFHSIGDIGVVDADGSGVEFFEAKTFEGFSDERVFGFGAEAMDVAGGVVTAEGGEIDAFNGADEVGGLMFFFDGAASGESCGAAVDGRSVDGERLNPVEIKGDAGVTVGGDGQVVFLSIELGGGGFMLGLGHGRSEYILGSKVGRWELANPGREDKKSHLRFYEFAEVECRLLGSVKLFCGGASLRRFRVRERSLLPARGRGRSWLLSYPNRVIEQRLLNLHGTGLT